MQRNVNSLPAMVKPDLPAPFIGKIDSVLVNRFLHQLDNYFRIVGITDDIKMGQIAITLLEVTAYNWFTI